MPDFHDTKGHLSQRLAWLVLGLSSEIEWYSDRQMDWIGRISELNENSMIPKVTDVRSAPGTWQHFQHCQNIHAYFQHALLINI